jgi:hypothetical protein
MTTITVYKDDNEINHESIKQEYYIAEASSGELFWHEKELYPPRGGALKIWLQNRIQQNGVDAFLLCYVFPDWQLIIDGVWMEKKFYQDMDNLNGKQLELRYKEYRFVFQFD